MCSAWGPRSSGPSSPPSSRGRSSPRNSTAASATCAGLARSRRWKGRRRMARSRLHQLSELGQSVWIDYLSRHLLRSGELARMLEEDAVVGVTSNPTIFQKAIAEGDAYDEQFREVLGEEDDPKEVFLRLAVQDVQDACDLLRPVWDGGGGQDGYVSLEVDPNLAYDTDATIGEAQRLHELVDRPNCFVKIPATRSGLPAIEE